MAFSNHAVAGCGSPSIQVTGSSNIIATLSGTATDTALGKTICTIDAQEEHHKNGELWDYKTGLTTGIDPRKKIGDWSVTGDNVNYVYGSNNYSFTLFDNGGGSYTFCDGSLASVAEVTSIVPNINVGCGFPAP